MATAAAEKAARVRAALKAKGWGRRQVSVRCRNFSMGSAVDVEIFSAEVDESVADEILRAEEQIDRDAATGEILGGSNCYVHITHSNECKLELARPLLPALQDAVRQLHTDKHGTELVEIVPGKVYVGFQNGTPGPVLQLWGEHAGTCFLESDHIGGAYHATLLLRRIERQRAAEAKAAASPEPIPQILIAETATVTADELKSPQPKREGEEAEQLIARARKLMQHAEELRKQAGDLQDEAGEYTRNAQDLYEHARSLMDLEFDF